MSHLDSLPTGDWFVFCCEVGGVEDNVLGSELDMEDTEAASSHTVLHLLRVLGPNPCMYS